MTGKNLSVPTERKFVLRGGVIPDELVRSLHDSTARDGREALQYRMQEDGYVFLRGLLDPDEVLAARREVFSRLFTVDEIRAPAIDGIATGRSRRRELTDNLPEFWKSVSEGPAVRRVSHSTVVQETMRTLFGELARPQDYVWVRPRPVGWSTGLHYDHPFFARGSRRVHTVWIPLGNIPVSNGPLVLVEQSHQFSDIIDSIHDNDQDSNDCPAMAQQAAFEGDWSGDTVAFLLQRRTRFLTADFQTGDVLVFGMDTLHGSLDNRSPNHLTRLSVDVRYQPFSHSVDDRYFGPNPTGASGQGYGDMNSCKPLTEIA